MRGHHVAYTLAFLPAWHRLARASLNALCGTGGLAWRAADAELYGRSIACLLAPAARGHAAEQRDERAALDLRAHSITSSAATCSVGGTVRPSALAVLRFITHSNLVGCKTGKSAGFSPLRIRPV